MFSAYLPVHLHVSYNGGMVMMETETGRQTSVNFKRCCWKYLHLCRYIQLLALRNGTRLDFQVVCVVRHRPSGSSPFGNV